LIWQIALQHQQHKLGFKRRGLNSCTQKFLCILFSRKGGLKYTQVTRVISRSWSLFVQFSLNTATIFQEIWEVSS